MARNSRSAGGRRPLPDRISLWTAEHRGLAAGAALIAFAAAFAVWATIASLPLESQRSSVIEWLGGGVYMAALLLAAIGLTLAAPTTSKSLLGDRSRKLHAGGLALALLTLWWISGSINVDASLGGSALSEHGVGGRIGGWFDSPIGWAVIAAAIAASFTLIAPGAMRRLLRSAGGQIDSGLRWSGRELRRQGPMAVSTMGRWLYAAALWLLFALGRVVMRLYRELRDAVKVAFQRPTPESAPPPIEAAHAAAAPAPAALAGTNGSAAWPSMVSESEAEVEPPPVQAASPKPKVAVKPVQARMDLDRTAGDGWRLPGIDLLDEDPAASMRTGAEDQAQIIVQTLASFGVDAQVTQINEGPAITQFGVEPGWEIKTKQVAVKDESGAAVMDEQGQPLMESVEVSRTRVRVNRITRLADDLALALAAPSIRIEAPVPGQPIVGVEVPNADTRIVALRGLIESDAFREAAAKGGLPIALGRDVTGNAVIADLTRMPHVLIAGATGSGKSVCINTIITSLLMHKSPEEVRLILVDPKRVELTNYGSAPHLAFSHVVTEPEEVVSVLGVVVAEMDRRYRRLQQYQARNIVAYNALPHIDKRLPYWVVVLDELADMMLAAPAEVETQLVRLAQLARAVGIHLVVATQRPSVDVVTGLIKANFPTRIAFAATSQTDARVILDRAGAEKLMGRGDMLYMSSETIKPRRVQGAFVSDAEIERILGAWSTSAQSFDEESTEAASLEVVLQELSSETPDAVEELKAQQTQSELRSLTSGLDSIVEEVSDDDEPDIVVEAEPLDSRLGEATELAQEYERVSATLLQRRMRIGRPRAERLLEQLAQSGVVEQSEEARSRRVLMRAE